MTYPEPGNKCPHCNQTEFPVDSTVELKRLACYILDVLWESPRTGEGIVDTAIRLLGAQHEPRS
jgi:hypothetical protein